MLRTNVVLNLNNIVELALKPLEKKVVATIMLEVAQGVWVTDFDIVLSGMAIHDSILLETDITIEEPDNIRINDSLSGYTFNGYLRGVFMDYWNLNYKNTVEVILNRVARGLKPKPENVVTPKVEEYFHKESEVPVQGEEPIFDAIKEAEQKPVETPEKQERDQIFADALARHPEIDAETNKPASNPLDVDTFMNSIPNSPEELAKVQEKQKQVANQAKQEEAKPAPTSEPKPEPTPDPEPVKQPEPEPPAPAAAPEPDVYVDDGNLDFSVPSFDMDGGDDNILF